MKICSKCLLLKGVSKFGKHNQTKDGLKSRCKLCHAAESRASRCAHVEGARAYDRNRYGGNRLSVNRRAYFESYRAENREKEVERGRIYREENGPEITVRNNKWKKAHPGMVNADTARRRAAKLKAMPKWANPVLVRAFYLEASRCGKEVDHIIPLRSPTVCGLHWEGNLQLLAPSENARKGNSYGV